MVTDKTRALLTFRRSPHRMVVIRPTGSLVAFSMRERFTRTEFLDALFGDYFKRRDGFLVVKTMRGLNRRLSTRFFPSVEILAKEQYQPDQEVFFGVCPRETTKADRSHIRYITALWAGIDLAPNGYSGRDSYFDSPAWAAKAVRSFPLPPSIIVESGYGMHLYWLFRDVMRIPDPLWVEHELRRFNAYFQCQRDVTIDTMLRLPETYNFKMPSNSVQCEVKYLNTDFRYAPEDFEATELPTDVGSPGERLASAGSAVEPILESMGLRESAEKKVENLRQEPEQSLDAGGARQKKHFGKAVIADQRGSRATSGQVDTRPRSIPEDFEPLPYELEEDPQKSSAIAPPNGSLDALADRVAEKVIEKLTDRLINDLVDRVVDELTKRLLPG